MKSQILMLVSEFNHKVTESLLAGALETLYKAGFSKEQVHVLKVPGAFELGVAAAKGAHSSRWDCVICLGCVIRGETPHFDYICQAIAQGLMQVSISSGKPVIFGVLTTDTSEQALERSGLSALKSRDPADVKHSVENKGVEAAQAAIQMLSLMQSIKPWEKD